MWSLFWLNFLQRPSSCPSIGCLLLLHEVLTCLLRFPDLSGCFRSSPTCWKSCWQGPYFIFHFPLDLIVYSLICTFICCPLLLYAVNTVWYCLMPYASDGPASLASPFPAPMGRCRRNGAADAPRGGSCSSSGTRRGAGPWVTCCSKVLPGGFCREAKMSRSALFCRLPAEQLRLLPAFVAAAGTGRYPLPRPAPAAAARAALAAAHGPGCSAQAQPRPALGGRGARRRGAAAGLRHGGDGAQAADGRVQA